jgi:hypothetical protein
MFLIVGGLIALGGVAMGAYHGCRALHFHRKQQRTPADLTRTMKNPPPGMGEEMYAELNPLIIQNKRYHVIMLGLALTAVGIGLMVANIGLR